MPTSTMTTSAETNTSSHTVPEKRPRVQWIRSGPGQPSQSGGDSSLMNNPAQQFPADSGAGELGAVHYIRPGRRRGAPDVHALGIFSATGHFWYDVPPMPFDGGIRSGCQCISLAYKIYVLGGVENNHLASREVFVFDLLTMQWTRCASMLYRRTNFGVGVLHGMIYAFGGRNDREIVREIEEYHPQVNSWSRKIPDILQGRVNPQVATMGEELVVFGGIVLDALYLNSSWNAGWGYLNSSSIAGWGNTNSSLLNLILDDAEESGDSDEVFPFMIMYYHSVENNWRLIETDRGQHWSDSVFMVEGRFYQLTDCGIYVYAQPDLQFGVLLSTRLHSLRFPAGLSFADVLKLGCRTIHLGGELWIATSPRTGEQACLLRTRGFGSGNHEIQLEKLRFSLRKFDEGSTIVFPVDMSM